MNISELLVNTYAALAVLYGEPTEIQRTLWCLTENVIYETSRQPIEGKIAVMETVTARVKDSRYPNDYCDVIHQPKQYSWTLIPEEFRWKPDDTLIEDSARLALTYLNGNLPKSSVHGATHFINPDAADYIPDWYWKYEYLGKIGDHEFFRRPDYGEIAVASKRKQPTESCTKLC